MSSSEFLLPPSPVFVSVASAGTRRKCARIYTNRETLNAQLRSNGLKPLIEPNRNSRAPLPQMKRDEYYQRVSENHRDLFNVSQMGGGRILAQLPGKSLIIWDGLAAHRSTPVKAKRTNLGPPSGSPSISISSGSASRSLKEHWSCILWLR